MFISLKFTEGGDKIALARAVNKLSRLFSGDFLLSLGERRVIVSDNGGAVDIERRVKHILKCAGCMITERVEI